VNGHRWGACFPKSKTDGSILFESKEHGAMVGVCGDYAVIDESLKGFVEGGYLSGYKLGEQIIEHI